MISYPKKKKIYELSQIDIQDHDAYLSYDLFDANITPLGWKQVAASLIML